MDRIIIFLMSVRSRRNQEETEETAQQNVDSSISSATPSGEAQGYDRRAHERHARREKASQPSQAGQRSAPRPAWWSHGVFPAQDRHRTGRGWIACNPLASGVMHEPWSDKEQVRAPGTQSVKNVSIGINSLSHKQETKKWRIFKKVM
jgi:hypothetical protein